MFLPEFVKILFVKIIHGEIEIIINQTLEIPSFILSHKIMCVWKGIYDQRTV